MSRIESPVPRLYPFILGTLGLAFLFALPLVPPGQAQPRFGQPIYPGYQGFLDNADGSVTVVFQYFSHGRDAVTIPVGERNQFTGVADRNQPTTFLPGNHEFVCVMVVDNREAAQALRWTVAFPEAAVDTSLDPLNSEYMLMENSQEEANRAIDYTKVARGVCLNKPPVVRTKPRTFGSSADAAKEISVKVTQKLELKGSARDEGLPRGSSVTSTWKKVSGPGNVSFDDAGSAETSVTFDAAGAYELELSATDGELTGADSLRVLVEAPGEG